MKKILSVILMAVFAIGACSCAAPSASAAEPSAPVERTVAAQAAQPVAVETAQPAPEAPAPSASAEPEESGPVCTVSGGGYVIDVLGAEVAKDGTGNDCIAIRFNFTNNNPQATSFMWIADDHVRQGGSSLTMDGMFPNGSDPSQTSWVTQISNGQSIKVTYIYPYNSDEDITLTMNIVKDFNTMAQLGSETCTLSLK